MNLDKTNFKHIKEIINTNMSVNILKSFCKVVGIDINNSSSSVAITEHKIMVNYRRKRYYVSYNHSNIYGTTFFNKI